MRHIRCDTKSRYGLKVIIPRDPRQRNELHRLYSSEVFERIWSVYGFGMSSGRVVSSGEAHKLSSSDLIGSMSSSYAFVIFLAAFKTVLS